MQCGERWSRRGIDCNYQITSIIELELASEVLFNFVNKEYYAEKRI